MTIRSSISVAAIAAAVAIASAAYGGTFRPLQTPGIGATLPVVLAQSKQIIHPKSSMSMTARLKRAVRTKRVPAGLTTATRGAQALIKEDCQWTNDSVAACVYWDCDEGDVCIELTTICYDHYGASTDCP